MTSLSEIIHRINNNIYLKFKVKQAISILKYAKKVFNKNIVVAFSGGKDSLVALHLALQVLGPEVPVLFNDTTIEFPETTQYIRSLAKEWGLNLVITKPRKPFFLAVKEKGWATHENRWCCRPYKEEPAFKFISENNVAAEVTGVKRTESIYRRSLTPIREPKRKENPPIIRINPIYDWNDWEVWRYIRINNLPYNPLYDKGYRRIGCWCCPLNGITHYKRLRKTHPNLYSFLLKFKPTHPAIYKLTRQDQA